MRDPTEAQAKVAQRAGDPATEPALRSFASLDFQLALTSEQEKCFNARSWEVSGGWSDRANGHKAHQTALFSEAASQQKNALPVSTPI